MIEGQLEGVLIATRLSTPDRRGQLSIRCVNLTEQPLRLVAGAVVGSYTGVEETYYVKDQKPEGTPRNLEDLPPPAHLTSRWEKGKEKCEEPEQEKRLRRLLT